MLAAALAVAQGAIRNPARNREVKVATKTGGSYTFAYATFDAILDAIRQPLADNGIAFTQTLTERAGKYRLRTTLMHASGQWLASETPLFVQEQSSQAFGSALTYMKRYALCALVGVSADEDDDGNAGDGHSAEKKDRAPPAKAGGNGVRKATPNPPAEEDPNKAEARVRFQRISARLKTAPRDDVIDQVLDDAREDLAFIKQHAGEEHVQRLYDKAAECKAKIAGIAEPTPTGAHP
jgi:hypothetical protein